MKFSLNRKAIKTLAIFVSMVTIVMLFPCVSTATQENTKDKILTIGVCSDTFFDDDATYDYAVKEFKKKYPDWSIQIWNGAKTEAFQKTGTFPCDSVDLVLLSQDYRGYGTQVDMQRWFASGMLADLSIYPEIGQLSKDMYCVDAFCTWKKRLLGLPYRINSTTISVNNEVYDSLRKIGTDVNFDVEARYSWENILQLGESIDLDVNGDKKQDIYLLSDVNDFGPTILYQIHYLAMKNGIENLDYDTPQIRELLKVWKSLVQKGYVNTTPDPKGKTISLLTFTLPFYLRDTEDSFNLFGPIINEEAIVPAGGTIICLSDASQKKDAALDFLQELLAKDAQDQYNLMGVVRKDAASTPCYEGFFAPDEKDRQQYFDLLDSAVFVTGDKSTWRLCADIFDSYISGSQEIDAAIMNLQSIMSEYKISLQKN